MKGIEIRKGNSSLNDTVGIAAGSYREIGERFLEYEVIKTSFISLTKENRLPSPEYL
jgi:hypothetical protein